jgi:hypothetical protein
MALAKGSVGNLLASTEPALHERVRRDRSSGSDRTDRRATLCSGRPSDLVELAREAREEIVEGHEPGRVAFGVE